MKYAIWAAVAVVILISGYWFIVRPAMSLRGPTNPPTAEDIKRIREIEVSSSQISPDAIPGAGVRPVGSLPKTSEPETATSSEAEN